MSVDGHRRIKQSYSAQSEQQGGAAPQVVWEWQPRALGRIVHSIAASQKRPASPGLQLRPHYPSNFLDDSTNTRDAAGFPLPGAPRKRAGGGSASGTEQSTVVENPMFGDAGGHARAGGTVGTVFPSAGHALQA